MSKVFIGLWLVLLMAIAAYIRVQGVDSYHYGEDEAMHIGMAQGATLSQVLEFSLFETHPPLGHVLRHYWLMISQNVSFQRSLGLILGIFLIPLYYRIGRLLKDEVAGMCCAALVAFSYGCILQSYIVRNYILFVLFLSLALYCYLLWRRSESRQTLAGYFFFCVLAALTHFSAIFTIFSIAAFETIRAWQHEEPLRRQAIWAALNIFIGILAAGVYFYWSAYGAVIPVQCVKVSYFAQLLYLILSNPIHALGYALFGMGVIPLIVFLSFLPTVKNDRMLSEFIWLPVTALILGMALVAAKVYFPAGSRHGIWVLPLVLPAVGWMMADAVSEFGDSITKKYAVPGACILLCAIIPLGWATYDPEERFAETEYKIKEENWQKMSSYLDTLSEHSVLIAARDNTIVFANIYPYLQHSSAEAKEHPATLIPFHHTHILFNAYYRRILTPQILLETLQDAKERGMLKGVDTLVFLKPILDGFPDLQAPVPYLLTCPALDKRIVSFPPFSFPLLKKDTIASPEEEKVSPTAFLTISKKDFYEQVVAPSGKAHYCLERKNVQN